MKLTYHIKGIGFSSIGIISLLKKQKIHCSCLRTILNVPISAITLAEELIMVILATLTLVVK